MEPAVALDHVRRAGERIAEAAEGHLRDPVPSCPDYDVGSLLLHTGAFCRYVRCAVEEGRLPDPDFSDVGDDALAWHRREHAALVDTLEGADPEAPGWSWGSDQRRRFWFRRAAHELSVHCWDVEHAVGDARPLDPALAADGVDEFLTEFDRSVGIIEREGAAPRLGGSGETLHFHATDLDGGGGDAAGEWLVRALPERFEVSHTHGKGDVAARATASDLLLFLWGRLPPGRLEVFGDASLLDRWRERVRM